MYASSMFSKWMGTAALSIAMATVGCSTDASDDGETSSDDLVAQSTSCSPLSDVPGMQVHRESVVHDTLQLRVGTMDPAGEPKGDILFLHGFADRFDNHLPLFETWRDAGFRVISFDYPSHGETCGSGIDNFRINGIAALAVFVEVLTRQPSSIDRPLLLAGWSTGGLVATRMMEAPEIAPMAPSVRVRPVKGAFLLAPGVDVKLVVGDFARVTEETLTSDPNPPHRGEITPRSPVNTPLFAADLILNAHHARRDPFPKNIPTMVVTGGENEDVYVKTAGVKDWVNARQDENARVFGLGCEGARHELDNEARPFRDDVRTSAARFASWVVDGAAGTPPTNGLAICRSF